MSSSPQGSTVPLHGRAESQYERSKLLKSQSFGQYPLKDNITTNYYGLLPAVLACRKEIEIASTLTAALTEGSVITAPLSPSSEAHFAPTEISRQILTQPVTLKIETDIHSQPYKQGKTHR